MTDEAVRQGGEMIEPSTRARELRATLGAIVEEAQQVSEQLVAESREAAAATTREAQDRADAILARARADAEEITAQARAAADAVRTRAEAEVEEHRRRVRAEVTEQVTRELNEQSRRDLARVRAQSHAVIGDLEASVRILGVSLESAVTNISDMLSALEALRSHMVDPEADPAQAAVVQQAPSVVPERRRAVAADQPGFAAHVPPRSVPAAPSVFDRAGSAAAGEVVQRAEESAAAPPLSATEAFLLSSQLDPGPDDVAGPFDEPSVGPDPDEESRRSAAAGEEARNGSSARLEPDDDGAEQRDEQGKPLGWLFRSPQ